MNQLAFRAAAFLMLLTLSARAQEIRVSPAGVNVYSQGATTVFLTYGNLGEYRPAETFWCGDVVQAAPSIGLMCAPGTIYGAPPRRYDLTRRSGTGGYTDVVSVPASVARKAYQAAAGGRPSEFYYVRRFQGAGGRPDQFVAVTMRLTGNGAGVPFSLTDVQLSFGAPKGPKELKASGSESTVLFVESGGAIPQLRAELRYTGTGRLRGRWEVVKPGDPLPEARDLLSEASLPPEERGTQQRFTPVSRFNVFLPAGGRFSLPGPDPSRLPVQTPGQYLILLRIEASGDNENLSDLAEAGAGVGVVESGAAAGFPMPVLRYAVGGASAQTAPPTANNGLTLLSPADGGELSPGQNVEFVWQSFPQAALYRLEVQDGAGHEVLSAVLSTANTSYRAPSWLKEKSADGQFRWRVKALDAGGATIHETETRRLRLNRN